MSSTMTYHGVMRVLHVTAELYPWVKSGGLGDVAAALPPALAALGVDTRLLLPGFSGFLDAFGDITDVARLLTPYAPERIRVARTRLPGTDRYAYLVDHPPFYDRPGNPYAAPDGSDWPDNHLRFGLFSWVAAALARGADRDWQPQILHCHDWHGALAPAYLAASPPRRERVITALTIHNLAYRGVFDAAVFPELALPPAFFSVDGVEFYGGVSFLKAGLFFADYLTTVSPTYAREIQTPDFGWGLDGLLRSRAAALTGILNGVDPQIWDPRHDRNLPRAYDIEDAETGKRAAKEALCRRLGLAERSNAPLYGVVSRLTPQKGLDLLLASLPDLVAGGGQLALLGSGDADLEQGFAEAARANVGRVAAEFGYDEELAHLIIGGADIVLVPSRFEPCGLTQLYALRYGALPLVRRVGGLADTVVDASAVTLADGSATGFAFDGLTPEALLEAIARAAGLMDQPPIWRQMIKRAMTRNFSWDAAARRYLSLYQSMQTEAAMAARGAGNARSAISAV
jgi:starch synthase